MKKIILILLSVIVLALTSFCFVSSSKNETTAFENITDFFDFAYQNEDESYQTYRQVAESYIDKNINELFFTNEEGNPEKLDFVFLNKNHEEKKLSDYQGKKFVIELMATWCEQCQSLIPDVEKYRKESSLEVLTLPYLEDLDTVEKFKEEHPLNPELLHAVTDGNLLTEALDVQYIPTFLFINEEGFIKNAIVGIGSYDLLKTAENFFLQQ